MKARITLFKDLFPTGKEEAILLKKSIIAPRTWPDKKSMPLMVMATFGDKTSEAKPNGRGGYTKPVLRHQGNMISLTGAELDYDNKDDLNYPLEKVEEILKTAGIGGWLYTSPSHTPTLFIMWLNKDFRTC